MSLRRPAPNITRGHPRSLLSLQDHGRDRDTTGGTARILIRYPTSTLQRPAGGTPSRGLPTGSSQLRWAVVPVISGE
jgi:hypothetical protein